MNINDYKGLNILDKLETEAQRMAYMLNWEQLHINYGDNVDWQRLKNQILLCGETKEFLYNAPMPVRYVMGKRPELEKVVSSVTANCAADRDKVLKILEFIRDLYITRKASPDIQYYGGSEEVLIAKGENLCECVSRLMVSLCEIIGLPGRIIMHLSGHLVCEIYLDGRWSFFDPRAGMFYIDENNKLLSIVELTEKREYILNQPDWVKGYVSGQWTYEQRQKSNYDMHMTSKEIQLYEYYSLMDSDNYNFGVKTHYAAEKDGLFVINGFYRKCIQKIFAD